MDVCIVGAGFSGLSAALKLKEEGLSFTILEARNRVGGRVHTEILPDGTPIDWGGTFIGAGHDRLYALAKEYGCVTYNSNMEGDKQIFIDGHEHRFSKTIPRINPLTLADLGIAIQRLNSMASEVPLEAPWEAKNAFEWDSISLGTWIDSPLHILSEKAKNILRSISIELFSSDPHEISLLYALFMIQSLKTIEWIISEKGGAQQDLIEGGMQTLAEKMAADLGDAIHFNAPVHKITQNAHGVEVYSINHFIQAKRVIVTAPPFLAGRIEYEPPLPQLKSQLMDRTPMGQVIRCYAVYEEPFWRRDGLSGMGIDIDEVPQACIDTSPLDKRRGVLTAYIWGPPARRFAEVSAEGRKEVFIRGLVKRFGQKASTPLHFSELDWSKEKWTRGAVIGHYAPGVLTGFGKALRVPCGNIHWAGTETSIKWSGSIEGALLSGERAAGEVISLFEGFVH